MWVVGGAVMSILLFLLASASSNTDFFDQNYSWLLLLNGLVAAALLVLVIGETGAFICNHGHPSGRGDLCSIGAIRFALDRKLV